jgi:hypothetical protein
VQTLAPAAEHGDKRAGLMAWVFPSAHLRAPLAERVAARLEAMGALTSAKDAATYG